ncbi:hypothetical protein SAMN04488156_104130 [Bacillus sp. 166amftsu]|nr:hypothetical protein SAMN04488156_104130 [Bacillus sp. 166amftsu]
MDERNEIIFRFRQWEMKDKDIVWQRRIIRAEYVDEKNK